MLIHINIAQQNDRLMHYNRPELIALIFELRMCGIHQQAKILIQLYTQLRTPLYSIFVNVTVYMCTCTCIHTWRVM